MYMLFPNSPLPPADHQAEPQAAAARGREQGAGEARENHVLHHRSVLDHQHLGVVPPLMPFQSL